MSNDKPAEEIERDRILKDADDFAFQVPYNGTNDFYDKKKFDAYLAGATHEYNRSAQQLKEYRDVIRELLPLAEDGYKLSKRGVSHQEFLSDDRETLDRARKMIDQTDSTK